MRKIRISYKGEYQTPDLMITEEEYINGQIVHANVLCLVDNADDVEIVFDEPVQTVREYQILRKDIAEEKSTYMEGRLDDYPTAAELTKNYMDADFK